MTAAIRQLAPDLYLIVLSPPIPGFDDFIGAWLIDAPADDLPDRCGTGSYGPAADRCRRSCRRGASGLHLPDPYSHGPCRRCRPSGQTVSGGGRGVPPQRHRPTSSIPGACGKAQSRRSAIPVALRPHAAGGRRGHRRRRAAGRRTVPPAGHPRPFTAPFCHCHRALSLCRRSRRRLSARCRRGTVSAAGHAARFFLETSVASIERIMAARPRGSVTVTWECNPTRWRFWPNTGIS